MKRHARADAFDPSQKAISATTKRGDAPPTDFTAKGMIILSAFAAGFCNAALGAGGGRILSFALTALSSMGNGSRSALALSQAAMIPCCLFSAIFYCFRESLSAQGFFPYAIPAILGGIAGGMLSNRLNPRLINRLFSILVIWSGIKMILK